MKTKLIPSPLGTLSLGILLLGTLLLSASCSQEPKVVNPGQEDNGAVSGKCYQLKSDNPFEDDPTIIKILEVKDGYMRYYYTSIGFYFDHSWERSDSTRWINKIYREVECP